MKRESRNQNKLLSMIFTDRLSRLDIFITQKTCNDNLNVKMMFVSRVMGYNNIYVNLHLSFKGGFCKDCSAARAVVGRCGRVGEGREGGVSLFEYLLLALISTLKK